MGKTSAHPRERARTGLPAGTQMTDPAEGGMCRVLGRRAELALQRVHAKLVLAQCGLPAPKPCIEPHDGAVHGLLQRVQRQETKSGSDGRLGVAGLLLMGEQTAQGLDRCAGGTTAPPAEARII
jgi:hypothetical protein